MSHRRRLNQTTGHWDRVTHIEKTQAVRSEPFASGHPELAEGLRPNGERIHCQ
jgi:hypothetical protein